MKIYFNEEEHSYKSTEPPITFTSVSKVLELVKNPFDKEGQSKKTAEKRGITQEEVLKEWQDKTDKSCERGTRIHLMKEKSLIGDNVYPVLMDRELKISYDLSFLPPGLYPELIIHSPYFKVCGTSDLVEIFLDKTFFLSDWKTNETISFEGYPIFDKVSMTKKPKKMRPPLTHLDDCKGQIYTLQLSIYAYLLEQFGYTCKGLRIDHIILDEEENIIEEIPYPIPYLKKEAFTLLNHFKSKSK